MSQSSRRNGAQLTWKNFFIMLAIMFVFPIAMLFVFTRYGKLNRYFVTGREAILTSFEKGCYIVDVENENSLILVDKQNNAIKAEFEGSDLINLTDTGISDFFDDYAATMVDLNAEVRKALLKNIDVGFISFSNYKCFKNFKNMEGYTNNAEHIMRRVNELDKELTSEHKNYRDVVKAFKR